MKSMFGIGLVCGLAWSMHAQAASFNCDKAKTTPEHAICEYRQINDADVKMATTYTILKRLVPMGVAWYTTGFPGSAKLRNRVNEIENLDDLHRLLEDFQNHIEN